MQQVLFNIPFLKNFWVFPADGIPVSGFGAMLFVTFIVCTVWATQRGKAVGMPKEKVQDMVIWLFFAGLIGARLLYMIQYAHQFPDKNLGALIASFFQIWKGGIIFYGSALGGVIGYGLFYWFVLRRLNISGWQLADAMAPILALGLAIGRIGCYLNGCCWGQVAVEEVCPVPLGGAHFPLLPAHARDQLVREYGLQSSTGFIIAPRNQGATADDPRSIVQFVERYSPAANAGLMPGDRIVKVNGKPNAIVVEVLGSGEKLSKALAELRKQPGAKDDEANEKAVAFDSPTDYVNAVHAVDRPDAGVTIVDSDGLAELVRDWPRGQHELELGVLRDGKEIAIRPFVPRTVALYPTQLYETISMILLIFLILAYYPFRHHDGELMVLCMIGYAIHRFVNESIRIEPAVGLGLTLSQWGSVLIFAAAVGIEIYLWRALPSRWKQTTPSV
ncbi:MAG TPA: prolipoprotein diacylglyceryl transferase family protein [Urbifossiella sp.]|jgi:prolipoprotein diacylglyceryltransferase